MKKRSWFWGFVIILSIMVFATSGCGGGNGNSTKSTQSSTSNESTAQKAVLYVSNKSIQHSNISTVSIGRWGKVGNSEDPKAEGIAWKDIVPQDKKVYDKAYKEDITVETYEYDSPVFNRAFDKVAYSLTVSPRQNGPKKYYVVISDLQGKEIKRFEFEKEDSNPGSWSYDDSYILVSTYPGLSVINVKTSNVQKLITDDAHGTWSPDSPDIACLLAPENANMNPTDSNMIGMSSIALTIVNAQTGQAREYPIPGTSGITWLPKVNKIVLDRKAYDENEEAKVGSNIPAVLFDPVSGQTSGFDAKGRFVPESIRLFTKDASNIIAGARDTQLNQSATVYMGFDGSNPLVVKNIEYKQGSAYYLKDVDMKTAVRLQDNPGNVYLLNGTDYFMIKGRVY